MKRGPGQVTTAAARVFRVMTPTTYRCPVCGQPLSPLESGVLKCNGSHAVGYTPQATDRNHYYPAPNGRLRRATLGDVARWRAQHEPA